MHKQTNNQTLLKEKRINTRLHNAPVFQTYKPTNELAKANVFYRGAIEWNALDSNVRNLELKQFKTKQRQQLSAYYGNN